MDYLWFCHVCLISLTCSLTSASVAPEVINRTVGEDCVLVVSVAVGRVIVLEWTKAGADVFFYRHGKLESQDDHFKDRVQYDLKTLAENKGTLSVTLKNVRPEDSGIYLCKSFIETSASKERFTKTVQLNVIERSEALNGVFEARKLEIRKDDRSDNLDILHGVKDNAANGSDLGVILGVLTISILAVVVIVGVWQRKRITDFIKKLKNSHRSANSDVLATLSPTVSPVV